jgi:alkaline phosphatase
MNSSGSSPFYLNRRAFIHSGSLFLMTAGYDLRHTVWANAREPSSPSVVRLAMMTDLHYADKPPAGSRHYRETLDKLSEAAVHFQRDKPDFVVELGDLVDAADSVDAEREYLKRVNRAFAAIPGRKHYVLGNHCVDTLYKQEFLEEVDQAESYYSFDEREFHFIVLDSCFRNDGAPYGRKNSRWDDANIPAIEQEWLRADLEQTQKPVIVLAHQRLDVNNNYGVRNAVDVRKILEDSGKVLAVFQGHSHKNDYRAIAGIHYCTLAAMVEGSGPENNSYSMVQIFGDRTIQVSGFRRQSNYRWT